MSGKRIITLISLILLEGILIYLGFFCKVADGSYVLSAIFLILLFGIPFLWVVFYVNAMMNRPIVGNEAYREIAEKHNYAKLPEFAYYPGVYEDGAFDNSTGKCECCEHKVEWIGDYDYDTDSVFGRTNLNVCPWCLGSGAATVKYGKPLNEFDESGNNLPQEIVDTIRLRTPHLNDCYQLIRWQGCCNDAMCYLGPFYSKEELEKYRSKEFNAVLNELKPPIDFDKMGDNQQLHLFQCRHCGKYSLELERQENTKKFNRRRK